MNEIKLFHIFLDIGYYIGKYVLLKEKVVFRQRKVHIGKRKDCSLNQKKYKRK